MHPWSREAVLTGDVSSNSFKKNILMDTFWIHIEIYQKHINIGYIYFWYFWSLWAFWDFKPFTFLWKNWII